MKAYLQATSIIDCDHPKVIEFAEKTVGNLSKTIDQAVALYYAVRDQIAYNPYRVVLTEEGMRASRTIIRGQGYCGEKSIVMAAACRHLGIPSRLGFANVRNHLSTEKFRQLLRSDIFVFHGYLSIYLEGKWVKATPVFDKNLCDRFKVVPLDFNGREDSIFQEFDNNGERYMEYLHEYGEFADMPLALFTQELQKYYPHMFDPTENEGIISSSD